MAAARKFLLAVDDSEVSSLAFSWAAANVLRPEQDSAVIVTSKIISTGAAPPADIVAGGEVMIPLTEDVIGPSDDVELAVKLEKAAEGLVDKFMQQCKALKIESEGAVVAGDAAPLIVAEAESRGVQGIVVGSHGRGLLGRTLFGSISDEVLHNAKVPVVIVRGQTSPSAPSVSRVVAIAVDESRVASHAFHWALDNIIRDSDLVFLLHVQPNVAVPTSMGLDQFGNEDVYVPPDSSAKEIVKLREESERMVEDFLAVASKSSKAKFEGRVVSGAVEEKLRDELSSLKADVVIVGSHDKDFISRTFLGSVSSFLSHNSPCPVIVVKPPSTSEATDNGDHAHAV